MLCWYFPSFAQWQVFRSRGLKRRGGGDTVVWLALHCHTGASNWGSAKDAPRGAHVGHETASATTEHMASFNKELGQRMFFGGSPGMRTTVSVPSIKTFKRNTPALQYVESLNMQRSFSVIIRTKYPVASTTREAQSCDAQVAPRVGAQASGERGAYGDRRLVPSSACRWSIDVWRYPCT